MVIGANPGGVGHHWLARRYVFRAPPWTPFLEEKSGREWIYAPSTYRDNEEIDQEQYRKQLESACPTDKELLRAWTDGDWSVSRGAYFADVLEESRNAVEVFAEVPKTHGVRWDTWLAHDYGSSAPAVTYLMARSPGAELGGRFFPRDSIVVLGERAIYRPDNLNLGLGWTASKTAEDLVAWCTEWGVRAQGVADDACFSRTGHASTIADEFSRAGVTFWPARKADRISGWQKMKRLLADAGKPDKPGLYVSRSCEYFWATAPYLARDVRRVEDLDSSGPDHGCDAMRYGLLRNDRRVVVEPLRL
jgi:hypothetical protein